MRRFALRFAWIFGFAALLVVAGTTAFRFIAGWGFEDSLWMTIITVTAVGYEEVNPMTPAAEVIAAVLLIGGITMMGLGFAVLTSAIVEMDLAQVFRIRRKMNKIEQLKNHVVVCGAGRTGRQVIRELTEADTPYLVVERSAERAEYLNREFPDALVLEEDATRDETLVLARIGTARGLVACLSQDTDNLFVCLSARDLQPNLNIVARGDGLTLRLEEIRIPAGSPIAGKTLSEARIPQKTGLIVIAMRHLDQRGREGPWSYNPGPQEEIRVGDVMIVMGNTDQIALLDREAQP